MQSIQRVRKTDLARSTRQVINNVLRGQTAVVESHGQPEVAIMDIVDYRITRAVMRYFGQRPEIDVKKGLADQQLTQKADLSSLPKQSCYPSNISVSRDKKIYIADQQNHMVHILNGDYSYNTGFGSRGSSPGRFYIPRDLALGKDDQVYIIDQGSEAIIPTSTEPDIVAKLAGDQSPRGWGLFLIENMVDKMEIQADEHHHTLRLMFNLKEKPDDETTV